MSETRWREAFTRSLPEKYAKIYLPMLVDFDGVWPHEYPTGPTRWCSYLMDGAACYPHLFIDSVGPHHETPTHVHERFTKSERIAIFKESILDAYKVDPSSAQSGWDAIIDAPFIERTYCDEIEAYLDLRAEEQIAFEPRPWLGCTTFREVCELRGCLGMYALLVVKFDALC